MRRSPRHQCPLLDAPLACLALVLEQLNSTDNLAFFSTCHTARRLQALVLSRAGILKLNLPPGTSLARLKAIMQLLKILAGQPCIGVLELVISQARLLARLPQIQVLREGRLNMLVLQVSPG